MNDENVHISDSALENLRWVTTHYGFMGESRLRSLIEDFYHHQKQRYFVEDEEELNELFEEQEHATMGIGDLFYRMQRADVLDARGSEIEDMISEMLDFAKTRGVQELITSIFVSDSYEEWDSVRKKWSWWSIEVFAEARDHAIRKLEEYEAGAKAQELLFDGDADRYLILDWTVPRIEDNIWEALPLVERVKLTELHEKYTGYL